MLQNTLFVYGSLRQKHSGQMADWLRKNADYLGQGFIKAKLYDIDGYPGAVQSVYGHEKVTGDIYKLTDANSQFHVLDEYEECSARTPDPHEYIRKLTNVYLLSGGTITAWVYWYHLTTQNLHYVASGDYLNYLSNPLISSLAE